MWDLGGAYELPTSEPHTDASGSSSLLPTPDAALFNNGQSVDAYLQRKAREKAKGYNGNGGGTSLCMFVQLLPTPASRDHKGQRERAPRRGGRTTPGAGQLPDVVALLPTPRATDGTHGSPNQRGRKGDLMLPSAVVQLLPTPTVQDSQAARNATTKRSDPNSKHHSGQTLTDVFWTGASTEPQSHDGNATPENPHQPPLF